MWFKISRLGSFIANWDVLHHWAAIFRLHLVSWFIVVLASNARLPIFLNVNSHFNLNPTYFIIKQHSILSWSLLNKEKQRQEGKTILCSLQVLQFIATLLTRHLRFICDPSPYFPLYWTSISHKDKVMPKSFKWLIIFAFIVCRPFRNMRWKLTMPALYPPFLMFPRFEFEGLLGCWGACATLVSFVILDGLNEAISNVWTISIASQPLSVLRICLKWVSIFWFFYCLQEQLISLPGWVSEVKRYCRLLQKMQ